VAGASVVSGKTGMDSLQPCVRDTHRGELRPHREKAFFHVLPGSRSFSIATVGCNFRCDFCQNHEISQRARDHGRIDGRDATPREIVERALRSGARSIAYTYTEPTVYFEFARETAASP